MRVQILDDWSDTLRSLPCFDLLDGHDVTVWTDHETDVAVLAARVRPGEAMVLVRERSRITAELLDRLPNLRLISLRGAHAHVDVDACTRNGVLLCSNLHARAPSHAAAELTLALILASWRQIPDQVNSIRAGDWQAGVGRTLRGRRLGLYGYGRIAGVVAGYADAIGMDVQWWGSKEGRARARTDGRRVAESREAFFATSDIVSLHVRLTPETRGIVTGADLAAMADRSLLVNTSRAGLIEPGALESEARNGRLLVATDVFETEPLQDPTHVLLSQPNVLPTPHIGYVTEDELELQFRDVFEQINAFARGDPIHMVNPEVLDR